MRYFSLRRISSVCAIFILRGQHSADGYGVVSAMFVFSSSLGSAKNLRYLQIYPQELPHKTSLLASWSMTVAIFIKITRITWFARTIRFISETAIRLHSKKKKDMPTCQSTAYAKYESYAQMHALYPFRFLKKFAPQVTHWCLANFFLGLNERVGVTDHKLSEALLYVPHFGPGDSYNLKHGFVCCDYSFQTHCLLSSARLKRRIELFSFRIARCI